MPCCYLNASELHCLLQVSAMNAFNTMQEDKYTSLSDTWHPASTQRHLWTSRVTVGKSQVKFACFHQHKLRCHSLHLSQSLPMMQGTVMSSIVTKVSKQHAIAVLPGPCKFACWHVQAMPCWTQE